jgi:inorganic pyrophosphatase
MFTEALKTIPPIRENGAVNVIVETPTNSRDKFDLNHETGLFEWSLQMPLGTAFPFSFGFVPNTLAEDDDPIDIILMVDGSIPQGTLVPARIIGALRASQDDDGDGEIETRNDRLIAVPTLANSYGDVHDIDDLRPKLYREIAQFFNRYNALIDRAFEAGEPANAEEAKRQLDAAIKRAENKV